MINWGKVPLASVLPFIFDTFDGGTGASITLTGLALGDILVYKGTSMTQRASTAGFVLLDTDGIDIDLTTGIHGFSIDTGDNTDAGFFVAGSFYTVVVASVTIDAQTVSFVAGTFWLGPTLTVAGVDEVDVTHVGGTSQTAGDLAALITTVDTVVDSILVDTAEIGAAGAGLTNINLPNQTMDITGNITGNLSGSVGSVADGIRIEKNTALANFMFLMVDSTDHVTPKTGLTITATRSIDGAAFGACANAAAEVASGIYKISLAATDLNGDVITLRFTGTAADDRLITIVTTV